VISDMLLPPRFVTGKLYIKNLALATVCHEGEHAGLAAIRLRIGHAAPGTLTDMDENRARRVTDALRDRGIAAHLRKSGIDAYSVQVPAGQGREAIWGAEGTTGLEAEILLDGDLVGFVPQIPGSEDFDEAQIVDAIARADYDQPVGRERDQAPPPDKPLAHEGGVFRRFLDGFRYDSE
jgi:hypothetical protein